MIWSVLPLSSPISESIYWSTVVYFMDYLQCFCFARTVHAVQRITNGMCSNCSCMFLLCKDSALSATKVFNDVNMCSCFGRTMQSLKRMYLILFTVHSWMSFCCTMRWQWNWSKFRTSDLSHFSFHKTLSPLFAQTRLAITFCNIVYGRSRPSVVFIQQSLVCSFIVSSTHTDLADPLACLHSSSVEIADFEGKSDGGYCHDCVIIPVTRSMHPSVNL